MTHDARRARKLQSDLVVVLLFENVQLYGQSLSVGKDREAFRRIAGQVLGRKTLDDDRPTPDPFRIGACSLLNDLLPTAKPLA